MQINVNDIYNNNNKTETIIPSDNYKIQEVFQTPGVSFGVSHSGYETETKQITYNQDFSIDEIDDSDNSAKMIMDALNTLKENITPEGYSKMEELGLAPDSEDVTNTVTIDERIEIMLMAYCDGYEGSGISVSKDKINAVLGTQGAEHVMSKKAEQALYMAENIVDNASVNEKTGEKELPESAKIYLLKNNLEPTIANTYVAMYSGNADYSGNNQDFDIEDIKGQIKNIYEKSGLEYDETAAEESSFLINNDIPVNENTVRLLRRINSLEFNMDKNEIRGLIEGNTVIGINAGDIILTKNGNYLKNAQEAIETLENATSSDLNHVITNNNKLTLESLKEAENIRASEEMQSDKNYVESTNPEFIKGKRIIAEARMIMTTASFVQMQKLGININTTELENITMTLRSMENGYYTSFFNDENSKENAELFTSSMNVMKNVSFEFTYYDISFIGNSYKSYKTVNSLTLAQMNRTYEGVGTQVRKDLGDNILKAFNNVDGLLRELGFDVNEENRKAARILGYNSMELTNENMSEVKEISSQLDRLIDNFKPATVMKLIKEGINPLNTQIKELNKALEDINQYGMTAENSQSYNDEKYSKFLWRLEKAGDISQEERTAYISMYRLLNAVSKNDGNYVGELLKEGKEINLKNLLSAVRTRKVKGIDISLDDKFGLTESIDKNDDIRKNLEDTLNREEIIDYTNRMLKESAQIISPQGTKELFDMEKPGNVTPETLYNIFKNALSEYDRSYEIYKTEKINMADTIPEEMVNSVIKGEITPSVNNILAVYNLFGNDTKGYRKIKNILNDFQEETDSIDEALQTGTEKDLQNAYESLHEKTEKLLEKLKSESMVSFESFNELREVADMTSVMEKLSKKRDYTVEGTINKSKAVIHLSIGNGVNNTVKISWKSEEYGMMYTQAQLMENELSLEFVSDSKEVNDFIHEKNEYLKEKLKALDVSVIKISVRMEYTGKTINTKQSLLHNNDVMKEARGDDDINGETNVRLYKIAKCIMESVM